MLRRRPLTATPICTLPERAERAAAFYEPPRDEQPQPLPRLSDERDTAAAA